jgi:hypothetical protein
MILGRNAENITFISKKASFTLLYVNNIPKKGNQAKTPLPLFYFNL